MNCCDAVAEFADCDIHEREVSGVKKGTDDSSGEVVGRKSMAEVLVEALAPNNESSAPGGINDCGSGGGHGERERGEASRFSP